MKQLTLKISGIAPLIMHNGQLADPIGEIPLQIKAISSLRKKTDADHQAMARLEFLGGLYLYDGAPCIPGYVFEGCLIGKGGAARKLKSGKIAMISIFVDNHAPLEYDGSKDPEKLWENKDFVFRIGVKVGQATIMRVRPIFNEWSATFTISYNEDLIARDVVIQWAELAGEQVGVGDWRPKHGRFTVEVLDG